MLTKILFIFAISLIALATVRAQSQTVFACRMDKLSSQQRDELRTSLHNLIDAKPSTKELANGYQLTFPTADHYQDAVTWISYERLCCPFFEFSVKLAKNDGAMTIQLTGPKGVKQFIAEDLPVLKALATGAK